MMNPKRTKILQFLAIVVIVAVGIWLLNRYGIENLRANVKQFGIWAPIAVGALRFTSIVIPMLPNTAYSALAGVLFGFQVGLLTIWIADFIACMLSFQLSRQYGRDFVRRFIGDRFMGRVESLGKQHLENNFFMTLAFLMTGFFDFVCYGLGLTKVPWRQFLPALVISIVIAHTPAVAIGAGVVEKGKGMPLIIGAVLVSFGVAIVTGYVRRKPPEPIVAEESQPSTSIHRDS
jgi:uncharacterized membrane protein YdjX (TVP38/TMEM64 family)